MNRVDDIAELLDAHPDRAKEILFWCEVYELGDQVGDDFDAHTRHDDDEEPRRRHYLDEGEGCDG